MKKGQTAAAILLLAFALNGCGGGVGKTAFAPTETSLYVTKEGTVTSADVEICENDYYSADELKAYAQEMLDAFESENQSGSSEKKAEITECTEGWDCETSHHLPGCGGIPSLCGGISG